MTAQTENAQADKYRSRRKTWLFVILAVPIIWPVGLSIPFASVHGADPAWFSWPLRVVLVVVAVIVYAAIWLYSTARISEYATANRSVD